MRAFFRPVSRAQHPLHDPRQCTSRRAHHREQQHLQQRSPIVLHHQVSHPEAKQHRRHRPVRQQDRHITFHQPQRRTRIPRPPQMRPDWSHQIPLSVLLRRLPIRENRRECSHAAPQPQQQKLQPQVQRRQQQRSAQIKSLQRQKVRNPARPPQRLIQQQSQVRRQGNHRCRPCAKHHQHQVKPFRRLRELRDGPASAQRRHRFR